jgi:hypothetical protein
MRFEKGFKGASRRDSAPPFMPEQTKTSTQVAGPTPRTPQPGQANSKTVTIEARIDVGFGNSLYLRGEGHGLSWNQGIPLTCVGGSMWKWSGEAGEKFKFKLLLNDLVWAKGEDLVVKPGERLQVAPAF